MLKGTDAAIGPEEPAIAVISAVLLTLARRAFQILVDTFNVGHAVKEDDAILATIFQQLWDLVVDLVVVAANTVLMPTLMPPMVVDMASHN